MNQRQDSRISPYILDTLELTSDFAENVPSEVFNEGLELNGDSSLNSIERRARSKYLTTLLAYHLTDLDSPLRDNYIKTYYCSHTVTKEGGKYKSTFCKKRWCVICNRIRTAQLMHTYLPTLKTWENKQFVTLTLPNCSADDLRPTIYKMYKSFTLLKDNLRKTHKSKLVGLRKLEITYNRFTNKYHPHYHLITESNHSEFIISSWLKSIPNAEKAAQDARIADENSCFELFKYFAKLTSNSSKDKVISVHALDEIFQSITGIRTFQPFGFVAHVEQPPVEHLDLEPPGEPPEVFNYKFGASDWLSSEGEFLSNFNNQDFKYYAERFRVL